MVVEHYFVTKGTGTKPCSDVKTFGTAVRVCKSGSGFQAKKVPHFKDCPG